MILQVGKSIHCLSRFVVGFVIGFARIWQISLVTLAIVPVIAISGGIFAYTTTGFAARIRKSYVKAGEIAEEVGFLYFNYLLFLKYNTILLFFS